MCKFKEKKYQKPPKQDHSKMDNTNKDFRSFVKPVLRNKSFIDSTDITLKLDNNIIAEETKLVGSFNNHYINIVEHSSVLKPTAL